ncbi:hypothetical protein AB0K74_30920, partial [Streptomyces sp. NPDC056159]|uniref:VOC family protein n=1 Tax=Streptomyces sp. NPDC056159 TaxID=3155537 RepID=UPI00342EF48A
MTAGLQTIIYPVKDLDRAKALFSALLEVEPYADAPYYVGFKAAGQDVGLDPNGHAKGMTGPVPYWHVDDIRARLAALVAAGALQFLADSDRVHCPVDVDLYLHDPAAPAGHDSGP